MVLRSFCLLVALGHLKEAWYQQLQASLGEAELRSFVPCMSWIHPEVKRRPFMYTWTKLQAPCGTFQHTCNEQNPEAQWTSASTVI